MVDRQGGWFGNVRTSFQRGVNKRIMLAMVMGTVALWLAVTTKASDRQERATQPVPVPARVTQDETPKPTGPDQTAPNVEETTPEQQRAAGSSLRESTTAQEPGSQPTARVPMNPVTDYGLWVLVPALAAILLAIFMRQVVPALVIGILVGAYMMFPCLAVGDSYASQGTVIGGFRLAIEHYILGAIHQFPSSDFQHLKILVFTLMIGFVVGVIGRNGGTRGMVKLVVGRSQSPRRGALTAWLAGLVVFFDDYANTMIIGPTMRSVFDRLKLSRAKLAYIVDSTAAPVASIALIGTWVGAEVGYIDQGLKDVATNTGIALVDAQGQVLTGMQAFIHSIEFRFYPILALFLVFWIALTGRDFGPMKRSEREAAKRQAPPGEGGTPDVGAAVADGSASKEATPCWWLGFFPILALVIGTVGVLAATGYAADTNATPQAEPWWQRIGEIVSHSDSYLSIFYGAVFASLVAVILTLFARACSMRDAVDAGLEGMARMLPALVILVLAWAISAVLQDLNLGQIVADRMKEEGFQAQWLPLAVFVTAAFISFATGTSWGTMGILCPMTVTTTAGLIVGLEPVEATNLLYAAIGSVLAGSVFGDHCSPISDTTVLSSIASGCRHEEHVWTQIPYALVAAVASMGLGDLLCSVYKQPWYYGMGAGAVFLMLFVLVVGRRAVPKPRLVDADLIVPSPPSVPQA